MSNIVIMIILIIVIALGIRETIKHFKGEGACCGGGAAARPKTKKLKNQVIADFTLPVEGMHCKNCAYRVERAINDIDGVSARVNLRKKTVKVSCNREIDPERIKEAIRKQGYETD